MLSKGEVGRLRARKKEYLVYDSPFLFLRVYPSGRKKWIFRRRVNGKDRQATLGEYPAMGMVEARIARDNALKTDADRQTAGMPLSELFALWQRERRQGRVVPARIKTERHCFSLMSRLHNRGVRSLSRVELIATLREMSQKSLDAAWKSSSLLKMMFDFAVDIGELEEPHCALRLSRGLPRQEPKNFASIHDPAEIGKLLRAIEAIKPRRIKIALKVIAYTFMRQGELRTARWEDIDFDAALWTIPAANTKKRRELSVPLARQVTALLNELDRGDDRVFGYLTHARLLYALNTLQRLPPETRPQIMTIHGFRSMASTILNEHEWPSDAIERQLAHVSGGVRGVYNKALYLDKRREMMQWYADYLDSLRDTP